MFDETCLSLFAAFVSETGSARMLNAASKSRIVDLAAEKQKMEVAETQLDRQADRIQKQKLVDLEIEERRQRMQMAQVELELRAQQNALIKQQSELFAKVLDRLADK